MKYFFILTLLSLNSYASAGKVPASWMSSENQENHFLNANNEAEMVNLEAAYLKILEMNQDLFKDIPLDTKKQWKLQSIKTELALSAEGTIGVMGAGGEAALELVWIRKGTSNGSSSFVENSAPEAEEIQMNGEMNEAAILKEITPIVDVALSSQKRPKRQKLLNRLYTEAIKFQKTIRELESAPIMGPWYAYKYQLELYVSAEGDVLFFEAGNAIRLRLEWWRLKKDQATLVQPPFAPNELSENARFISGIASDLQAMGDLNFENGFKLNCLKVGVGTTIKGNLLIVKSKASATGSIFFKRDDISQESFALPNLMEEVSSYGMIENNVIKQIPRMSFRSGIEKAAKIATFFAKHANTKKESKFELRVIETELELFTNGGVGIVNVEGSAGLTLFATRNVTI
jgi:hypothetical protein